MRLDVSSARPPVSPATAPMRLSTADAPPLVVDVDQTLLSTDLLWEGMLQLGLRRPGSIPGCLRAAFDGKGALKEYVARTSELEVDLLPLRPAVTDLVDGARAAGRTIVLASGACETQVASLAARVGADVAIGSTRTRNLTGDAKLAEVRARFDAFDYVGDSAADLPLWRAATTAIGVDLPWWVRRRAQRDRPDLRSLSSRGSSRLGVWTRQLRPHQWAKNALLFLPALAAHADWTPALALQMVLGFCAFSALASAVYIMNDLADLAHDRRHPTKRTRPIAAGAVSIPGALAVCGGLMLLSAGIASVLPAAFGLVLVAYLGMTAAYSLTLKRRAIVDVITLATLYTTRVVAGSLLAGVVLSRWFLAFSVFLFFSLALVKRVMELLHRGGAEDAVPGRGYTPADVPVLVALGGSATAATSLVLCLYITGPEVTTLYARPDLLWAGLPLSLYWQARMWLLAMRMRVHEDPVVFALRDRTSHLVAAAFMLCVFLAS